jgi:hypothetical protein
MTVYRSHHSNATRTSGHHPFISDFLPIPPQDNYRRLDSQRFRVIYASDLEASAADAIKYLEEAHSLMTPFFVDPSVQTTRPTTVILTDSQDMANGFSSSIGRQGLVLLIAPPDPYSSIGDYDNWLRNLIFHEYAHYLTLTPTRGIFSFSKILFGEAIFPNQMWPTWLSEGLAVYAETRFTKRGRGNSAYYDTLTRTALADDSLTERFLTFDELSGPVPDYPFGGAAYYAGYAIVDEIYYQLGDEGGRHIVERGAGRIPYFLNGTLEAAANKSSKQSATTNKAGLDLPKPEAKFRKIWQDYAKRKRPVFAEESKRLQQSQAEISLEHLTDEGAEAAGGRVSPDGKWIAYTYRSGHELPKLIVRTIDGTSRGDLQLGKPEEVLSRALVGPWLSWSANGETLLFSRVEYTSPFHLQGDLYTWSQKDGVKRITHNARAKDPSFCREGFVYVALNAGKTSLVYKDGFHNDGASESVAKTLYQAPWNHRIATPRCDLSGQWVYFTEHGASPNDTLKRMNLSDGKIETLTGGDAAGFAALFPEPLKDGSVLFTRMGQGKYELAQLTTRKGIMADSYKKSNTASIRVIASALPGLWMPSASGDFSMNMANHQNSFIYVTTLSHRGLRLARLKPLKTGTDQVQAQLNSKVGGEVSAAISGRTYGEIKPRDYWFWQSMQPRLWSPYLRLTSNRQEWGALVAGWDDVDQFRYQLLGAYDSMKDGPVGEIITDHRIRFGGLRFGLAASSFVTTYSKTGLGRAYNEERKIALTLSRPTPSVFAQITPYVAAEWARVYFGGDFSRVTYDPEWRFAAGVTADTRQRVAYSIAPELGFFSAARIKRFQPLSYFKDGSWKYLLQWNQLLPAWPMHSSFAVNIHYAASPNPKSNLPESFVRPGSTGSATNLDPPLRGYNELRLRGKQAAVAQLEYRLPLAQVFRAHDTFPYFSRNLGFAVFTDVAKVHRLRQNNMPWVIGSGAALLLNGTLGYHLPMSLRIEFARGFSKTCGGENQFSLGASL